jgi:hypothetical protein
MNAHVRWLLEKGYIADKFHFDPFGVASDAVPRRDDLRGVNSLTHLIIAQGCVSGRQGASGDLRR